MWTSLTPLRNLLFLSLTVLLTGWTNTGGGGDFSSDWNPSFPSQPVTFTIDGVLANMLNSITRHMNTPNMCDCWEGVYDLIN